MKKAKGRWILIAIIIISFFYLIFIYWGAIQFFYMMLIAQQETLSPLDKNTAENVLKNYTVQYLKNMNMNLKIDNIEAEFGHSSGGVITQHPAKPGVTIHADSYSGSVMLSNDTINGTLKIDYDSSTILGFKKDNMPNAVTSHETCIANDDECILKGWRTFECMNKMTIEQLIPEYVSKYFSCICQKTENERYTSKYGIKSDYTVRICSLDFSVEVKNQNNKLLLIINTPNHIPEITIKTEKCQYNVKDLQPETNEIKTDCDYDSCVRIFYKEFQITEINCPLMA